MLATTLLILFGLILLLFVYMSYRIRALLKPDSIAEDSHDRLELTQGWIYAGIVFTLIAMVASLYSVAKGTLYEGHIQEWLNIIVRVMHITFGIAWIGASFYFVFLENALNRKNVRDELAGDLWAVHGGGFYYLEKYKGAPATLPKHLHWFKYEAYFTWLSGIGLLFIVYYLNAGGMMIKNNSSLSPSLAILSGLGSFIVAWIIYDLLCKSALKKNKLLFALTGIVILVAFAWAYTWLFTPRAAFIHFGAMIGSLMAANVFFVIIPSQKAMVKAAKKGMSPDLQKGKNALFRSIHNNYFTLPVLFVMVSNHFPSTFGNKNAWIVLAGISIATAGIKHWLNLREQGRISVWVLPVSVILLLAIAWVTAPVAASGKCREVAFAEVNQIIEQRCITCHSSRPTDKVYTAPPNGVVYDTPRDITAKKDLILQRVVHTKTMPLNNQTGMTPEERETIRCWIENGAPLQ
jgi:uncharacterized membrane protein